MFIDNWCLGLSVNEGWLLERFIYSFEIMFVFIIILLVFLLIIYFYKNDFIYKLYR